MNKIFDIPGFTYFAEKNKYTGSVNNNFNYKILTGDNISVTVWVGKFCLAKTPEDQIIATSEFDLTPEGLEQMKAWIEQQYNEFKNAGAE